MNWNTRELVADCLDSVFQNSGSVGIEVIVVDNGSTDGSCEMVQSRFPAVRLVRNSENMGFAPANNQAIRIATAPYILLLNSDTKVVGNALETMHAFAVSNPSVGAVGPQLIHPQDRFEVLSCGFQPTLRALFNHYFLLSKVFKNSSKFRGINLFSGAHDDRALAVEWMSGACMMVPQTVIDQVGMLDESWFMYAEDMEWCDRIGAAGLQLFHLPEAIVEHIGGASMDETTGPSSTIYVSSLRSYFIRRENPSAPKLLAFDLIVSSGMMLRAAVYLAKSRMERGNRVLWGTEARRFSSYARAVLVERRKEEADVS